MLHIRLLRDSAPISGRLLLAGILFIANGSPTKDLGDDACLLDLFFFHTIRRKLMGNQVEVYFKESKRHLGLLKEQTNSFASHIASTHLAAIRFCMLIYAMHDDSGLTASAARKQVVDGLVNLSFAKQLWVLFRALIYNGLASIKQQLGCSVDLVMGAIEERINYFFVQALQLDPFTLEQEALNHGEP